MDNINNYMLNNYNNLVALQMLNDAALQDERGDRIFHERQDPFELSDRQFIKIFRLNKVSVDNLITVAEQFMTGPSRASALDVSTKVLTALKFFGTGSYQSDVGLNIYTAISQSSVSRCVKEVSDFLNEEEIIQQWIYFPRNYQEMCQVRDRFWDEFKFPSTIGVIDCTHVAIFPPPSNNPLMPEPSFVNRKNYHSMNTQLISDANYRIINVDSRFPGSTHDSFIWNSSFLQPVLRELYTLDHSFFLIGDSGYALRPWMITPFLETEDGTAEEYFNNRLKITRSLIERVNGVLKMRFRCLLKHRVLHYDPLRCSKIINACCVLHNMCIEHRVPEPPREPGDEIADLGMYRIQPVNPVNNGRNARVNPELEAGRRVQRKIVRMLWDRRQERQ